MKKYFAGTPDSIKKLLREYAESLTAAIVIAIILRVFIVSAFRVPTAAMAPSLLPGDFIFGYKLPFVLSSLFDKSPDVVRGDLIIFKCPDNKEFFCVKRAVAQAGDLIEIKDGQLIINGTMAKYADKVFERSLLPGMEFYTTKSETLFSNTRSLIFSKNQEVTDVESVKVPEGQIFVLGDNRDTSDDSRSWGAVPEEDVIAKAVFIWLSLDWQRTYLGGRLPSIRWHRVLSSIN